MALFVVTLTAGCGSLLFTNSEDDAPPPAPDASSDGPRAGDAPNEEIPLDASSDGAAADAPKDATTDEAGPRRIAFVTSGRFAIDGIAGDALDKPCKSAAQTAGLGGTFASFLSTGNGAARNRVVGGGPWYTTKGDLVASQWADLVNGGTLAHAIDVDEGGNTLPANELAWTGSNFVGQVSMTCSDWMNVGQSADVGDVHATSSQWIQFTTALCSSQHHVYCFEQ